MIRFSFISGMVISRSPREGDDNNPGNQTPTPTPTVPTATPAPTPQPGAGGGDVTFSEAQQAKVNKLLADERRKAQEANKQLVSELETRKQQQGLSEQEKQDLQKRIDDLTSTFTTKEEQAKTEIGKLQKKYDTDIKTKDEEAKAWRQRYENRLKTVDLRDAAHKAGAIRPEQVEKLLWDQTVVEEELDDAGKPTGEFVTKVNFVGKDKEGKPVKLKLSVPDAIKAMTEAPEEYGNLFESKAKGGVGQAPNQGGGTNGNIPNIENMTPQEWQTYRQKIRAQMTARS